jgi:hypothetical protein
MMRYGGRIWGVSSPHYRGAAQFEFVGWRFAGLDRRPVSIAKIREVEGSLNHG